MHKYGIIGFGGLGKLHLGNLITLERLRGDISLVAICGANERDFKSNVKINLGDVDISSVDFSLCNFYTDYREMLEAEELDFVICTLPTYLHEEVAVYALNRGIHVFSEKPMAISLEACQRMISASEESGKHLMIGNCLRFDLAYQRLKEIIDDKIYGNPYRAEFVRYSETPRWTWNNWILDPALSGGCPLDLHIHDVDLIYWFFGMPKSLDSFSTNGKSEAESIFTRYDYDGLKVTASADWSMPASYPFKAYTLINFERASVLLEGGKISVYEDSGEHTESFDEESAFMCEMRAFLNTVIDGEECMITSPRSVMASMELLFSEIEKSKS